MTCGLQVLKCIRIYSKHGIFYACNYTSSIFWEEVSDVIASSTEVSGNTVVGGGRYFSILEVERHLMTEPDSCLFCIKGEMFDNTFPWNVEVADDIGRRESDELASAMIWVIARAVLSRPKSKVDSLWGFVCLRVILTSVRCAPNRETFTFHIYSIMTILPLRFLD